MLLMAFFQLCQQSFVCNDKTIIENTKFCDGFPDCPDAEDENNCIVDTVPSTCDNLDEFTCNNGDCIKIEERCDGIANCQDNSDEVYCPKSNQALVCDLDKELPCRSSGCYPRDKKCDGVFDCEDEYDEFQCPLNETNPNPYFSYSENATLNPGLVPDESAFDANDVANKSSNNFDKEIELEPFFPIYCDVEKEFQCRSGQCVPIEKKCDTFDDCDDRSDELDCNENNDIYDDDYVEESDYDYEPGFYNPNTGSVVTEPSYNGYDVSYDTADNYDDYDDDYLDYDENDEYNVVKQEEYFG